MDKKVVVIIPFYKDELSTYESIALEQCFKILGKHPIIAIKPASLVLPGSVEKYPFSQITSFDDSFFANVQGYNRLMLSADFYGEFIDYENILIHQLDAFVFRDELLDWCNRGYDYIGSPWIKDKKRNIFKVIKKSIQYYIHTRYNILDNGLPTAKHLEYKVGNGGFSLRRTKILHDLCISMADQIAFYNSNEHHYYNEDIFWSVEVNRKSKLLKKPGYKKALRFSFEMYPQMALQLTKGKLPFGCHAWEKELDFWRDKFKQQGYSI
jgi:hypothetical protein